MGLKVSSHKFDQPTNEEHMGRIYETRMHSVILVVGSKGSGKTTLCDLIKSFTKINKPWIHIFDSERDPLVEIKAVYENGVDTSGLSVVRSSMPVNGIIWVIKATSLKSLEDFEAVKNIYKYTRIYNRCMVHVFFSHTDDASRKNMEFINALHTPNDDIPDSGEIAMDRIFYAPLKNGGDDAKFTVLTMVRSILDWTTYNTYYHRV